MFFCSILTVEWKKHGDFTVREECKSGWKAALGKELSMFQHQNSSMDLCVPPGAAQDCSILPLMIQFIKQRAYWLSLQVMPTENRPGTENNFTNECSSHHHQMLFNRTQGLLCLWGRGNYPLLSSAEKRPRWGMTFRLCISRKSDAMREEFRLEHWTASEVQKTKFLWKTLKESEKPERRKLRQERMSSFSYGKNSGFYFLDSQDKTCQRRVQEDSRGSCPGLTQ